MTHHPESRPNRTSREGRRPAGSAAARRPIRARAIPRPRTPGVGGGLLVQAAGLLTIAIVAFLALFLAGCGEGSEAPAAEAGNGAAETTEAATSPEATALAGAAASRTPVPLDHADPIEMRVYASPTCGCCSLWVDHLEQNGFDVETVHRDDMGEVKRNFGVGDHLMSCHTGVVNGYVVEGHVPAADIRRLLAEAPGDVHGLAVPGMPIGSPGMEMGDRVDPYDVLAFSTDGSTRVFASYGR